MNGIKRFPRLKPLPSPQKEDLPSTETSFLEQLSLCFEGGKELEDGSKGRRITRVPNLSLRNRLPDL